MAKGWHGERKRHADAASLRRARGAFKDEFGFKGDMSAEDIALAEEMNNDILDELSSSIGARAREREAYDERERLIGKVEGDPLMPLSRLLSGRGLDNLKDELKDKQRSVGVENLNKVYNRVYQARKRKNKPVDIFSKEEMEEDEQDYDL